MSDITEEEIARAIVAARNLPAGSDINWDAFRRDARAVLALLQPALERARREERERLAVWHDKEATRWNAVLWDRRSWGGPTMGAEECIHAEKFHKDTAAAIRKG